MSGVSRDDASRHDGVDGRVDPGGTDMYPRPHGEEAPIETGGRDDREPPLSAGGETHSLPVDRSESPADRARDDPAERSDRHARRVTFAPRVAPSIRMSAHRRNKRRRRIIGMTLLGVGLVVLLLAGWVAWRAYQAYEHLEAASMKVSQIEAATKDLAHIDVDKVGSLVQQVQHESTSAAGDVGDPIYRFATHLPAVGPNLAAVSTIADVVDDVAHRVLPSMATAARTINPEQLAPKDGAIDIAPIVQASRPLQQANKAVQLSRARLSAIDRRPLVGPVNDAVLKLWSKLDALSRYTTTGALLGRLVPPMLGSAGPRTYLVAFQNPAELRATGGIFGSYVVLHVDDGKVAIVGQGSAARDIGDFDAPVGSMASNLVDLYSARIDTVPMDVNFTPDFPTAASSFAAMYRQRTGNAVDGVIAMDPVTISYLLAGHPPIPIGRGLELTQQNAVRILLSTAYSLFPNSADAHARDEFLAAATSKVFAVVMSGGIPSTTILHGLQKAAGERRVLIWSAHRDEEADLMKTPVGGSLSASPDVMGVFFNDGTGAKLGYYLSGSVRVSPQQCDDRGRKHLGVAVKMDYSAPTSGLPDYVLGLEGAGAPYVLRTNVIVMGPVGGDVSQLTVDGHVVATTTGADHGHPVAMATVDLKPGVQVVVGASIVTAPAPASAAGATVRPAFEVTPGVTTWGITADPYRSCRPAR